MYALEHDADSYTDYVMCSYILEAWMDKFGISESKDQFIALSLMKYIQCEVMISMAQECDEL